MPDDNWKKPPLSLVHNADGPPGEGSDFVMIARAFDLTIDVVKVPVEAILDLREHYRHEMNCQIVHDSWHARGFTHSYHLLLDGQIVEYGSVGGARREAKTTIREFFVAVRCSSPTGRT